jgi:hypothetical protein
MTPTTPEHVYANDEIARLTRLIAERDAEIERLREETAQAKCRHSDFAAGPYKDMEAERDALRTALERVQGERDEARKMHDWKERDLRNTFDQSCANLARAEAAEKGRDEEAQRWKDANEINALRAALAEANVELSQRLPKGDVDALVRAGQAEALREAAEQFRQCATEATCNDPHDMYDMGRSCASHHAANTCENMATRYADAAGMDAVALEGEAARVFLAQEPADVGRGGAGRCNHCDGHGNAGEPPMQSPCAACAGTGEKGAPWPAPDDDGTGKPAGGEV